MDRAFVDSVDPCDVAGLWSISWEQISLRSALELAARRASQTHVATLASLVLPAPECDPLQIFRALQDVFPQQCFYWEQPSRHMALVGAGVALESVANGPERFTSVNLDWQRLRQKAVVSFADDFSPEQLKSASGPVLFGGFCFDPLRPTTPLWQDFPAGLLILPSLLFSRRNDLTTLTMSLMVQPEDNLDALAGTMARQLAHLRQTMAQLPELSFSGANESAKRAREHLHNPQATESWQQLVAEAVETIQQGTHAKIVLARKVEVEAGSHPFALASTLQCLRVSYPGANVFALQRGKKTFIGATPERLVHAQDGKLHTMALAGSARRGMTEEEDRLLGSDLLRSPKNRQEHEIVVATLRNALSSLCSRIWVSDTPELLRLKNIQHLQTAIVGELLPGKSVLDALHTLHPTPAVGGSPTEGALAFIREYENLDRGWYAGPIGWIDLQGNGEFAVALRSALLEKTQATLFAGCGIVADSQPQAEYEESCLKLQVILNSLSREK